MEKIIEYIVAAIKAILAFFEVEVNEEVEDNLESMFGGIAGYEPEV